MSDLKTLCLLPGLMCDQTVWAPQRAALIDVAQIHVPNFLGLDSFEAMARRTLEQAEGPLWLAGHSMGGRVALEAWRMAPERIAGLALMDTGVHGVRPEERAVRMGMVKLARTEGMAAVIERWLPPMIHPDRLNDVVLYDAIAGMIRRASPEQFEKQQHALLTRPDATGYLPSIACPTLVMTGRQDAWSPPAQHEQIAAAIPGATLTIIEDCGHMSTLEKPGEVTALLRSWLARG